MNDRDFSDALVWIANSPIIAIDTETTGKHCYEFDRITGIGVANEHHEAYFPLRHPSSHNLSYDQARNLIELLSHKRERILFHNAIFDWPFLRLEGWRYLDPHRNLWDTMVVAWLLDENEPKRLEEQVEFHIDAKRAKEQKERQKRVRRIGWENATYEEMQAYGANDARNTYDLYLYQAPLIAKDSELAVARIRENWFIRSCDEMIEAGVQVNRDEALIKLRECDKLIDALEQEYPDLNFDSPPQIAKLLFTDEGWGLSATDYTSTGQASTSKDTLLRYLPYEPRIQDIFDYRKLRKARSTYYFPLTERVGIDGRVHPWYRPHGTKTGRMSCSDPNCQTLPHEETLPGIKDCFIAADGYSLIECDLSQAELRVAAYYADDLVLREHLFSGDVHSATAIAMFGDAEPEHRFVGKTVNFSSLYGVGAKKLSLTSKRSGGAGFTEDQARQYLGQWRNLYGGVTRALKDAQKVAEERGHVKLWPIGRRRRFDTYHARFENPKDALSSIVQGGVGEYVKELMMHLRASSQRLGVRLVLNVHDSIVSECPVGTEDEWAKIVRATAKRINPFLIDMPVGVKKW